MIFPWRRPGLIFFIVNSDRYFKGVFKKNYKNFEISVLLCPGCLEWPPLGANFCGGGKKILSNLILKVWIISVKLIPHMTWYHVSWLRYGCLKFPSTPKFSLIFKISNADISAPRGRNSKNFGGLIYLTWGHFWAKFKQF